MATDDDRAPAELGTFGKLRDRMASLGSRDCPFLGEWNMPDRRFWLRPEIRIEVRALPQRPGSLLRHATIVHTTSGEKD
jgi:hypothetical protein